MCVCVSACVRACVRACVCVSEVIADGTHQEGFVVHKLDLCPVNALLRVFLLLHLENVLKKKNNNKTTNLYFIQAGKQFFRKRRVHDIKQRGSCRRASHEQRNKGPSRLLLAQLNTRYIHSTKSGCTVRGVVFSPWFNRTD